MATIKNLVFKGGGVLGIAYAGAIKVLETKNILQNVERVAGTSAGAITAMLLSLRYSADEIRDIVNATSFKSFEDGKSVLRIPSKYGLYSGDTALNWLKGSVAKKDLPETATFRDFKNKGCRDLHVYATDLNEMNVQEFSFDATPDIIVAEAVRASMSIPLFFKAWQFSNNAMENHIYVDGGMVYNYPIFAFDTDGVPNPETLGCYLSNLHKVAKSNDLKYWELFRFIKFTFETMLDAQVIDFEKDLETEKRTINIDNLGISATDFDLSKDQEDALYNSGVQYANQFFDTH